MAKKTAVTPLEIAFVEHLTTPGDPAFGNAAQAIIDAGYHPKTRAGAANMGNQLKQRPRVKAMYDERMKQAREEIRGRAPRVVEETYQGAVFDPKDMLDEFGQPLPLHLVPARARRALTSVKIEMRDRVVKADDGDRVIREPVVAEYKIDRPGDKALFLRWAGELKDKLELSGAMTIEQLVLAADRKQKELEAEKTG